MNVLRDSMYINATMKNIKVYTEEEIASPKSEMERKKRQFLNEKAERLVKSSKTSKCGKTTIAGVIDVAWTLRKTSFIEEARKLIEDEKEFIIIFAYNTNNDNNTIVQLTDTTLHLLPTHYSDN